MLNVFDCAYSAAQRTAGAEVWERLSDVERMQAIARQIGFSLLHWDVDIRPDLTPEIPDAESYLPQACQHLGCWPADQVGALARQSESSRTDNQLLPR